MKKRAWPLLSFLMVFSLFSCETEESIPTGMTNQKGYLDYIPVIQTAPSGDMDKVKNSEVTVIGELSFNSAISGSDITYGHCWSMNPSPTINDASTSFTGSQGEFESSLFELEEKTQYFVRGYATYNGETYYGESISFYSKDAIGNSSNGTGDTNYEWDLVNSFIGQGRSGAVTFSADGYIYVGTGNNENYVFADFWRFNPQTEQWTQVATYGGEPRTEAIAFSLNNRGYVGTGYADVSLNDFWEYNPFSNQWTQKQNFPKDTYGAVAFSMESINGLAYAGLGENNNYFYRYNPTSDSWTNIGLFPGLSRTQAVSFQMTYFEKVAYMGLGKNGSTYYADLWKFSPYTNTWTQTENFPGGKRSGAISCSTHGTKGIIGMGYNGSQDLTDIWLLDQNLGTWTQLPNYPGGDRHGAVSFSYDDKLYLGTGLQGSNTYTSTFYSYDLSPN